MTEDPSERVQYRLERARTTLSEAKALVPLESWHGCTNRLYYACFYAASALLKQYDFESKKHSGVLSLFNRHMVNGGIIPKEIAAVYNLLFDKRQKSDYADLVVLDRADVQHLVPQTEAFVDFITTLLKPSANE